MTDDDRLGTRLTAGLLALCVLAAILLVATGPEPCVDDTGSTACAATHREEP